MKLLKRLYKFLFPGILVTFGVLATSCTEDEPVGPEVRSVEKSILLYAVASNNLYSSFMDDLEEIAEGLNQVDLNKVDMMIYSVTPNANPTLKRARKDAGGTTYFEVVKEYDRNSYSTDPQRISEVISDFTTLSNGESHGLILWSHGTAWQPDFSDHIVPVANYSFGADSMGGKTDYCDIDELAEAIPNGLFNYIWFDCCYMASVECYYQLRDKANYFVGSPMEIAAEGNPYHLVLPWLARPDYSLTTAADTEARYFINRGIPVAMSVVDASYLESVADLAEKAITGDRPSRLKLQTYNRGSVEPLCDFAQLTREQGTPLGEAWDITAFDDLMDKLVIYKSCSDKDWRNRPIDVSNYSGLSLYYFEDLESAESEYYKTLDWFKRVYTTVPPFIQ